MPTILAAEFDFAIGRFELLFVGGILSAMLVVAGVIAIFVYFLTRKNQSKK